VSAFDVFTPAYRGGSGPPLVLLHGFLDTWRTWELVLPALERRHDVLAPTLAGHAGGPPLRSEDVAEEVVDAVERAMDAAGMARAHLVGTSLGGHLALLLATRGRALTVVALAPAGGWAPDDPAPGAVLDAQAALHARMRQLVPQAGALLATAQGRRLVARDLVADPEAVPAELLAHLMLGVARCDGAPALIAQARRAGWPLDAERVDRPVRVVWGTEDRLLPWPSAAARLRGELPQADWVELDGVGHFPQLEAPLETAQLVLGHTALV
jgi:pimeloyl-ACP methyl ester carboxylesterase